MEKLNYRDLVQKVISQHASDRSEKDVETTEIVFDTERDRYLLLYVGWHDEERMYGCPIHIDIKDGKIWIQRDFTEEGLANQLMELGVPKTDIVLGFRSPYVRQFTEFAVA
ncbi:MULTISPECIES: XisI protein [Planktothricoides]|uniref:XisI protein n=1 Tax=Planktothricoides raciborskii GIHE-MW2 TaxID=2792601 RepID=A0AAU8JH51_9CYAN|nr:XisI protein [Planktothricoides sp. SR001]KOR34048.1 fatty-acid oxidation protein subunit alpha [Planktothricoides sp. SR001]